MFNENKFEEALRHAVNECCFQEADVLIKEAEASGKNITVSEDFERKMSGLFRVYRRCEWKKGILHWLCRLAVYCVVASIIFVCFLSLAVRQSI